MCRIENEQLADKVLAVVAGSLSNYHFDFQGARIITGQEEGAYGWITINYLLGKFTQVIISHPGRWLPRVWGGVNAIAVLGSIGICSQNECWVNGHVIFIPTFARILLQELFLLENKEIISSP